jgi:hypothetical protein
MSFAKRYLETLGWISATLCIAVSAQAQQPALPSVRPPSLFDEGTQSGLTPEQARALLPWSFDAQAEIKDLLAGLGRLSAPEQLATLELGLRRLVERTGDARAALLMRYVLNRGLRLSDAVAEESPAGAAWVIDQRVRLLKRSAEFALKYAARDVQYLREGKVLPPYAAFGTEYAQFLMELSQSVIDASAQYRVTRLALGLLAWDLHQDEARLAHASTLVRLQTELDRQPELVPLGEPDADLVARVRSLRGAYLRALDALGSAISPTPGGAQNTSRAWDLSETERSFRPPLIDFVDPVVPSGLEIGFRSDAAGAGPYLEIGLPGLNRMPFTHPEGTRPDDDLLAWSHAQAAGGYLPARARIGLAMTAPREGQPSRLEPTYIDLEITALGGTRYWKSDADLQEPDRAWLMKLFTLRHERRQDLGIERLTTLGYSGGLAGSTGTDELRAFSRVALEFAHVIARTRFDGEMFPGMRSPESVADSERGTPYVGGASGSAGVAARLPDRMVLRIELGTHLRRIWGPQQTVGEVDLRDVLAQATLAFHRHAELVAEGGWSRVSRRATVGGTNERPEGTGTAEFVHTSVPVRLSFRYRF